MKKISVLVVGLLFAGVIFASGCTENGVMCTDKYIEFNNCDSLCDDLKDCECINRAPITDICNSCKYSSCVGDKITVKEVKGCDSFEGCEGVHRVGGIGAYDVCICGRESGSDNGTNGSS